MEGDDGDKRYMGQNDPYQDLKVAMKAGIKPDFSGDSKTSDRAKKISGGKTSKANETNQRAMANALQNAESAAGQTGSTSDLDAKSGENDVSSGFTNNVGKNGQVPGKDDSKEDGKGDKDGKGGKQGSEKGSGPVGRFMKKYMPVLSIILTISGGGSFMMLSQATLPFTALQGLKDWFNSIDISNFKRHSSITENAVKNAIRPPSELSDFKNPVKGKKYKVSKKFTKRLAAQNIEIPTDGVNKGKMVFTDAKGNKTAIEAKDFKATYDSNPEFRKAYATASHPFKTAFNNFKDKIFKKFKSAFGISGNKWGKNYNPESDTDGEKAKGSVQEGMDQKNNKAKTSEVAEGKVPDGKGGETTGPVTEPDSTGGGKIKSKQDSIDLPSAGDDSKKINDKLDAIGKVAGTAMAGLSVYCAFSAIAGTLSLVAAAEQLYRVVNLAMDYFTAFEQAIAGEGSTSPIHALGKSMVQTSDISYERTISTGVMTSGDQNATTSTTTVTTTSSAVTSQGFNTLFSHEQTDGRDDSVRAFNTFDQIKEGTKSMIVDVSAGLNNFRQCTYTRLAQAAVGIVSDIAMIASCLFTAGGGCAVKFLKDLALGAAKATAFAIAQKIATSVFSTWFKNFLNNLLTRELAGAPLGDALVAGMHAVMAGNHRGGGGVLADKAGYIETAIVQSEVLADKAKTERMTKSPFDYTSRYTFLGSLVTAMIPLTLQSKSVVGAFNKFGSILSSSTTSLFPGASAANAGIDAANAMDYTEKNCPYLYDIGVVGDAYCQPYTTTDFDTINIDNESISDADDPADAINSPYNIMSQVNYYDGFDLEGQSLDEVENPKIKKDSDLAEYIIYCNQRQSAFGIADQNIASEIDGTSTGSGIGDFTVGLIPGIGDGVDIVGATRTLEKFGYVDGSACVMHDEGTGDKIPEYVERRAYARYIEDQRYLESTGMIEQSAVATFLDEYYEEHPLDNSHEGIIARLSGLPKDTVIAAYDAVDFMNFLAEYDPTDYYPTPAIHPEEADYTMEDDRIIKDETFVAIIQTGYFSEYRQRNFASA